LSEVINFLTSLPSIGNHCLRQTTYNRHHAGYLLEDFSNKAGLLSIQNRHAAEIQLMEDCKKNVAKYIECTK